MFHTIIFLYIFDFKFVKGNPASASAILMGIALAAALLFDKKYRKNYRTIFRNNYHWNVFLFWFLLSAFSVVVTIVHGQYDFSFVKVLVHQYVIIEIGFFVIAFFRAKNKQSEILNIVIDVFIIQSLIMLFSMISPTFRELTNRFREDHVIEKAYQSYANARGMALSGTAFFGLAVSYGIIFILIVYHWKNWKYKSLFVRCICLGILCIGAVSAGRTSLIGIAVAFFYGIAIVRLKRKYMAQKGKVMAACLLTACLTAGLAFTGGIRNHNQAFALLYKYSFEMLHNFLDGKGQSSTSINALKAMYVPLKREQVLLGDGIYTEHGLYYMNTDIGYLRGILYFGFAGLLFLAIYQWKIMQIPSRAKKEQLFLISVFGLMIIYEFKGEVIGVLIMLQALLLLLREALQFQSADSSNSIGTEGIREEANIGDRTIREYCLPGVQPQCVYPGRPGQLHRPEDRLSI